MGFQQENRTKERGTGHDQARNAKSCMAILWVQNDSKEFDKTTIIDAVKEMTGVFDARFMKEKPAILMVDYCTKEIKAATLVNDMKSLGVYARIVGC